MASDDAGRLARTEATCARFMTAYLAQRFNPAVDIFLEALADDPHGAFRHFGTFATGQLSQALIETNRIDEVAVRLDALLADHPHMHLICPEEPDRISRLLSRREENIHNGLPSVVVAAMGKSASTAVGNIFHSGFDLPTFAYSLFHMRVIDSWARDFARGGACYTTHLDPSRDTVARLRRAGISRLIVHVRDPRQALVSIVHHFDKYPDQLVVHRERVKDAPNMSARAMAVLDLYSSSIKWIRGWFELEHEIDILFSTFEEFVSDRAAFVEKYLKFYGVDRCHFNWETAFGEHTGVDEHFRSGRTDEWREVFTREEAEYLSSMMPLRALQRFGWGGPHQRPVPQSGGTAAPTHRDRVLDWLQATSEPGDAAAREEVDRRVAAGDNDLPQDLEERATRATLRDYPDRGTMLLRLWRLIRNRGGQVPDGLAIHALRSRLAELSQPAADEDSDDRARERSEIARELAVREVLEHGANGNSMTKLLLSGQVKFSDILGYSKLVSELSRRNEFEAAEAACLLAIELEPSNFSLHRTLADVVDASGRPKEAVETLELLAAMAPQDGELSARLGHVLIRSGDLSRAAEVLRLATTLDGAPTAAWCDLADVLAERGHPAEAIAMLQGQVARGLHDPLLEARLGRLVQRHAEDITAADGQ